MFLKPVSMHSRFLLEYFFYLTYVFPYYCITLIWFYTISICFKNTTLYYSFSILFWIFLSILPEVIFFFPKKILMGFKNCTTFINQFESKLSFKHFLHFNSFFILVNSDFCHYVASYWSCFICIYLYTLLKYSCIFSSFVVIVNEIL